jgi:hypothetical protein
MQSPNLPAPYQPGGLIAGREDRALAKHLNGLRASTSLELTQVRAIAEVEIAKLEALETAGHIGLSGVASLSYDELLYAELRDVIVEVSLPSGLRACAYRDAMLAYDFSAWGEWDSATMNAAEFHMPRVQFINAHLACLLASVKLSVPYVAPASTENVLGVHYDDAGDPIGGGDGMDGGVVMNYLIARHTGPESAADFRFVRFAPPLERDALDRSYELIREVLESARKDVAIPRLELLVRARAA